MRNRPRKGLQDIRTRSSLASDGENPQRKYLRWASLELKKSLCQKVRDAARKRAEEMDRKIAELEAEESRLLAMAQALEPGPPCPAPAPHLAKRSGRPERRSFTLRY